MVKELNSIKKIILFSIIAFILLFSFSFLEYYIYGNYNFNYSRISILLGSIISGLIIAFLSKSIKNSLISMIIGGGLSLVIISYLAINKILLETIGIISEAITLQGYIFGRLIVLSLALLSTIVFSYPLSLKKPKEEEKIAKKIEEEVMVEKIQVREIPEEISEETAVKTKEEIKEEAKMPTPEEKIESFLPKEEIKEALKMFPKTKNCPYCNSVIPFEAIFCPRCGKKVVT
jgi:hypothetical protein